MTISDQEVEQLLDEVGVFARKSTDIIIGINKAGKLTRFGSCLYLHWPENKADLGVTCNHVLKENVRYFVGAKRLEKPRIPRTSFHKVEAVDVIKRFPNDDLAFFNISRADLSVAKKSPLDIFQSSALTLDFFQRNLKNAMVIFGVPDFLAEFTEVSQGSIYSEMPIYAALGPLVEADEDKIIGDFTEQKLEYKNIGTFPKLENEQATGGKRDLGGMSGSGGWIKANEGILVAGILAGPHKATDTVHLIRFVPVWKVISALKKL